MLPLELSHTEHGWLIIINGTEYPAIYAYGETPTEAFNDLLKHIHTFVRTFNDLDYMGLYAEASSLRDTCRALFNVPLRADDV